MKNKLKRQRSWLLTETVINCQKITLWWNRFLVRLDQILKGLKWDTLINRYSNKSTFDDEKVQAEEPTNNNNINPCTFTVNMRKFLDSQIWRDLINCSHRFNIPSHLKAKIWLLFFKLQSRFIASKKVLILKTLTSKLNAKFYSKKYLIESNSFIKITKDSHYNISKRVYISKLFCIISLSNNVV